MKYVTTLNEIKTHYPCQRGWDTLLTHLGKTRPDNEPVTLERVLHSNGLEDAAWCLRVCRGVDYIERDARLFAVRCARLLQRADDVLAHERLDLAVRYALGSATARELEVAQREAEREVLHGDVLPLSRRLALEAVDAALHASPVAAARLAALKALKAVRFSESMDEDKRRVAETATAIFRSMFCAEDSKPEPVAPPAVPVSDDTTTPPGDGWREASLDGDDYLDRRCEHLFEGEWITRSPLHVGCRFMDGHRYRIPIATVESAQPVNYVTGVWLDLEAAQRLPMGCVVLRRTRFRGKAYYATCRLTDHSQARRFGPWRDDWSWMVVENPPAGVKAAVPESRPEQSETPSHVTGAWLDLEAAEQLPEGCTVIRRYNIGDRRVYESDNYFRPGWARRSDVESDTHAWLVLEDPQPLPVDPDLVVQPVISKSIPPNSRRMELILGEADNDIVQDAWEYYQLRRHMLEGNADTNRDGAVLAAICSDWLRRVASGKVVVNMSTASAVAGPGTYRQVGKTTMLEAAWKGIVQDAFEHYQRCKSALESPEAEQPEE